MGAPLQRHPEGLGPRLGTGSSALGSETLGEPGIMLIAGINYIYGTLTVGFGLC